MRTMLSIIHPREEDDTRIAIMSGIFPLIQRKGKCLCVTCTIAARKTIACL